MLRGKFLAGISFGGEKLQEKDFYDRIAEHNANGKTLGIEATDQDPLGITGGEKEVVHDHLFASSPFLAEEQRKEERRNRRWTITKNAAAWLWGKSKLCVSTLASTGALIFFTPWRAVASWFKKRAETPPTPPTKPPVATDDGGSGGGDGSNPKGDGSPEDYFPLSNKIWGWVIWSVVVLLPAMLLGYLFALAAEAFNKAFDQKISLTIAYCGGMFLWFACYVGSGLRIVPQQHFIVIERLGRCYGIREAGIHILCFPKIIDKIHPRTNRGGKLEAYTYQRIQLYDGTEGAEEAIDFRDGSAGIVGEAFFRVKKGSELAFTYCLEDPIQRIETLLDDEVRTFFQQLEVQEALTSKNSLWDAVRGEKIHPAAILPPEGDTEEERQKRDEEDKRICESQKAHFKDITSELQDAGVELDGRRGIIVSDIRLTQELIDLRQLELEGKQQALRTKALGEGYAGVVKEICEQLGITRQEAIDYITAQKLLEVLPQTKSNLIMIGGQGGLKGLTTGMTG